MAQVVRAASPAQLGTDGLEDVVELVSSPRVPRSAFRSSALAVSSDAAADTVAVAV